ncbi:hypothetical protein MMC32_005713 [Xylographa parallela]|nr:hypothetical protein [Xylographa parallela]
MELEGQIEETPMEWQDVLAPVTTNAGVVPDYIGDSTALFLSALDILNIALQYNDVSSPRIDGSLSGKAQNYPELKFGQEASPRLLLFTSTSDTGEWTLTAAETVILLGSE